MSDQHDHGTRVSEDAFSPAADACPFILEELPCGCQDVHYACGYTDREHDHVACQGGPVSDQEDLADAAAARAARASIKAGEPVIPWEQVKAGPGLAPDLGRYTGYGDQRPLAPQIEEDWRVRRQREEGPGE